MSAFSTEQQKILKTIHGMISQHIGILIDAVRRANMRSVALHNVLLRRSLVTPEELQAAMNEVEAAVAVDTALDPDLNALEQELRRLIQG